VPKRRMSMSDIDAIFKAKAEQAEAEEREHASNRGKSFTFEKVKWTGLEPNKMKIIRAIGEAPDWDLDGDAPVQSSYDARVVRISHIIGDNGKKMKVVLPIKKRDANFLLWRIIDKVNEVEWLNEKDEKGKSKKVFLVKEAHPSIFNIVNFNNLDESDVMRKFNILGKGWAGREMFIMNVIDRSMMEWHKKNKHTVLLSKNVTIKKGDNDKIIEFVEEGVPAYGFTNMLNSQVIKFHGFWENYDIGIERTGLTTPAFRVICASKHIEETSALLQPLIVVGPLTDEEKSWERYDLNKLFGITSYTKLWNRLKLTIAKIDAELKTHFLDELQELAAKEAEARKAKNQADPPGPDTEEEPVDAPVEENVEVPVKETVAVGEAASLPAYSKLNDKEKKAIVSASLMNDTEKKALLATATKEKPIKDGQFWKITYEPSTGRMGKCPDCAAKSPDFFTMCPVCGSPFIF
jgi:hypothetical protein